MKKRERDVRRRKLRGQHMYKKRKKGEETNLIYNLIRKGERTEEGRRIERDGGVKERKLQRKNKTEKNLRKSKRKRQVNNQKAKGMKQKRSGNRENEKEN